MRVPLGPTWESDCGRVKLWLGDCLKVVESWPNESVDLIATDPPYGHNNNNGDLIARRELALGLGECGPARPIHNDGPEADGLYRQMLPHMYRVIGKGCCCCCCCGGGGPDPQFARWSLWMDEVFRFKQMLIWDKGPMGMGWHYRRSYETILVGEKPGAKCRWFGVNKTENIIRPGDYGIRKIIPRKHQHPCAKPVALFEHLIRLHTEENDIVADPLMGSGSCGVAAVRMGRRYWGIEIDELFFADAKRSIEEALAHEALFYPGVTEEPA